MSREEELHIVGYNGFAPAPQQLSVTTTPRNSMSILPLLPPLPADTSDANGFKHMTTENNTKIVSDMTFFKALPVVTPRNITVIA